MNSLRLLNNLLLTLASLAYPIVWFFAGQSHPILIVLPYLLAGLWLLKGGLEKSPWLRYFSWVMTAVLLVIGVGRTIGLMYWYPVIINGLMLVLFGSSLWQKQSLVERIARLQTPDLPPQAVAYTRKVTQLWCGVFLFNLSVTSYLIISEQFTLWAIYSGGIAYLIIGCVMAGEWFVRQAVKKSVEKTHCTKNK